MRRRTIVWAAIATMLVAAFATAAAPATAAATTAACPAIYPRPAYCDVSHRTLARTSHVGWVYLNLNHCPPGMMCAALYRATTPAWSWTGSAWRQSSLRQGWVYVYPYTGAWRWAWTQQSGWVAISGGRFEIRQY